MPGTQGECVVLHQDFHGGNVLRAAREPWLAIDPKPLVGEREFDTRGWAIAHALAWRYSGERIYDNRIACARWLVDA